MLSGNGQERLDLNSGCDPSGALDPADLFIPVALDASESSSELVVTAMYAFSLVYLSWSDA